MEQYIDKSALVAEIKRRIKTNKECMLGLRNLDYYQGKVDALNDTISFIDTLEVKEVQEEPVSEDLGEYINDLSKQFPEVSFAKLSRIAVRVAKWQEKQDKSTIELAEDHAMLAGMNKMEEQIMKNLWKPADGDDLPEYDREVIVLTQPYPLEDSEYAVHFAHRPDPKGWDGKSITTGEVEHYTPKTYDKGGWNIPDIKWWLDVKLPKEIEL